jgi:hypothetical protein
VGVDLSVSGESLEELDADIRDRLAQSLEHVVARSGPSLGADPARCQPAFNRIRQHRQHPRVFAHYYEMVFAIGEGRHGDAGAHLEVILEQSKQPVGFSIDSYSHETLGADYELFPRLLFAEERAANPMTPPPPALFRESAQNLEDALEIVERVDPVISGQIRALFSKIYVTCGANDSGAFAYAGATSFMIWGATFLNANEYSTQWKAVQFLVHEATHALLFALCSTEPVVTNPPDELFESPLRADLRPMDGIFHATLVCARITSFNRKWLGNCDLDSAEQEHMEVYTNLHAQACLDGIDVVKRHGTLTDSGRRLLDQIQSADVAAA